MPFTAGDRVTVRGERWIVDETTVFTHATLLHLSSADDRVAVRRCRLIAPFDRPVVSAHTPAVRATSRRRWMNHLHAQRRDLRAFAQLRAPARAAIDILPFQLEPALALIRGCASRFLLADEVGLGKTIQAGLMLAELRQRGWCEHALILTPAGLRHQWTEELRHRFGIRATVIDAASLAALTASLPFDVNPWGVEAVAITSIDFLKQPEVLHGLANLIWDVVIVDEAHQAALASQRHEAIEALARRARHVMLLTATPHAGDDAAYRALCSIGRVSHDEPILLFRRTREAAGLPRSRHVHLLPVSPTRDGMEMHRLLDAYTGQLWAIARASGKQDVQLVAMVLAKRAFSSARSLALSLERRLAGLSGEIDDGPRQDTLPFGLEDDASDVARMPIAPAFERIEDERALLQQLIDVARRAQTGERKMYALRRLARRVPEPLIVFTEFRDTLDAVSDATGDMRQITTLHGGQTAQQRRESVYRFTSGAADLMIATDAGSEGLNLQGTCRLVVNLELPWNPIRLEQRIGRVDRIGQSRTVHAVNLFADGTAEQKVLASLLRRIDRIRMSEIDIAACVIGQAATPPQHISSESCTQTIDMRLDACNAARHIADIRRFSAVKSRLRDSTVPVTVVESRRASLIVFYRVRFVARTGRLVEEQLLPIRLPLAHLQPGYGRAQARALAEALIHRFGPELLNRAQAWAEARARALTIEAAECFATAAAREHNIGAVLTLCRSRLVQAGLFDRRALKENAAEHRRRSNIRDETEAHSHLLEHDSGVRLAHSPDLAMLLIQCSRA